jgi:tetratricopeptide (TPR) repeat protein
VDRQRLKLWTLLLAMSLAAGCVSTPPASDRPGKPPVVDAGEPAPDTAESPEADTDGTTAPPPRQPDARAPTLALLRQSERSADNGDLAGAIAYVERAIRLNPRDAELWLRLARLQLAADRPANAEQLAQKAIALAGSATDQQRSGWLLVADAREAQGDTDAAARIRARWRTFRG